MGLENKVVLISGGSKGIGATQAKMFAAVGAKVVIGDILDDQGYQVEAEIAESGGDCVYQHLDVTSEEDWDSVVKMTVEKYGKLDVLVNNAGIGIFAGLEETSEEDWDKLHDVNVKGTWLGIRAAIPEMITNGGGSIINISSGAGIVGRPEMAAYSAAKGAVRSLTKTVAIEYASKGIRCNSVHPAVTETDMGLSLFTNQEQLESAKANNPMGRLGLPEDIANGILFLASDESSYMNGSELRIDGGNTAR